MIEVVNFNVHEYCRILTHLRRNGRRYYVLVKTEPQASLVDDCIVSRVTQIRVS